MIKHWNSDPEKKNQQKKVTTMISSIITAHKVREN